MKEPTARVKKTREQLDLLGLLRGFMASPLNSGRLEALCTSLVKYELAARFKGVVDEASAKEVKRAMVKAEGLCRDCDVKLVEANRARVAGYQCLDCKRKYTRENAARRRAALKAATP